MPCLCLLNGEIFPVVRLRDSVQALWLLVWSRLSEKRPGLGSPHPAQVPVVSVDFLSNVPDAYPETEFNLYAVFFSSF
jgi:hypothetical protein